MKKDETATTVIFRRFKDGDVIAILPYEIATKQGHVSSYMHIGQHSAASLDVIGDTKLATPEQYAELQKELESIGYVMDIKRRVSWAKYRRICRTACI